MRRSTRQLRGLPPGERQRLPGTFPPLDGSKLANGAKAEQIKIVLEGNNGHLQWLLQAAVGRQIAAVVTYERNSWGNTGDVVQPSEINEFRK